MEKVKLSGSNGNSKSRVDPYSSKTTKSLLNQATSGNVSYTGLETGDDGAGEGGNDDKRQGGASSGCLKRMFANYGKSIVFGGIDGLLLGRIASHLITRDLATHIYYWISYRSLSLF